MSDAALSFPTVRTSRQGVRRNEQAPAAWLLLTPSLILMFVILVVPIIVAAGLSFTSYSLGSANVNWVGFQNYERLFTRSSYAKMFSATFGYVAVVVPISIALGLGAALLINSLRSGGHVYRAIYFLPVMAALLAMTIAWEFTLHPTVGIVNDALASGCDVSVIRAVLGEWYAQGCGQGFPVWLGERRTAFWVVCFIGIWQAFGFNMVLYLAGLTSVPRELYQAAEMDGARSAWERFRLVTWPMLGPTTVFVVTITLIKSFQVFDTVEALFPQSGGPAKSTYVMMFAIYEKAVKQNLVGIGAAITVLFLFLVMAVSLAQRWWIERRVHYG
ncbi:MAG: sugar ABC transporter permease [Pseudomonadota bacterium]